jgi:hypothetical protein
MARRPDPAEYDKPLTRQQLAELERHLAGLDPFRVQSAYRQAYERCRLSGPVPPKASAIQELVTSWRILRRNRARPTTTPDGPT